MSIGETHTVDILVVGAGPVGLYGAYYAGFRGFSVAVVDALPHPGGQLTALYPEKLIYDIAGYPAVRAQSLVEHLVTQAETANPTWLLGEAAQKFDQHDDIVTVTTDHGTVVHAKAVVIAGGMGNFEPRPLESCAAYEGRGLRYFVPRIEELSGHDVVIVGGGDSAVDWALALEPVARSVTLIHRRVSFRAHAASVAQLELSSVRILTPHEVTAATGHDRLQTVTVTALDGSETHTLRADTVVAALGFIADLAVFETSGMELHRRRIAVDRAQRTSLPRVFAAGDVASYDEKVGLISVGFGEAATAVNHAAPLIDVRHKVIPGHSSDAVDQPTRNLLAPTSGATPETVTV